MRAVISSAVQCGPSAVIASQTSRRCVVLRCPAPSGGFFTFSAPRLAALIVCGGISLYRAASTDPNPCRGPARPAAGRRAGGCGRAGVAAAHGGGVLTRADADRLPAGEPRLDGHADALANRRRQPAGLAGRDPVPW